MAAAKKSKKKASRKHGSITHVRRLPSGGFSFRQFGRTITVEVSGSTVWVTVHNEDGETVTRTPATGAGHLLDVIVTAIDAARESAGWTKTEGWSRT